MKALTDPKIVIGKIRQEYKFLQENATISIPLWEHHCRKLHLLEWFYAVNFEKRFDRQYRGGG